MQTQTISTDAPTLYEVTLYGHLSPHWAEWFGGATITLKDTGEAVLTCSLADQAALHGVLKKVRDIGLPLVSVVRVDTANPSGA